jgi:hypothetical protein
VEERCLTYIERDGRPVPEPDAVRFAAWLARADRRIAFTALDREVTIETLFLDQAHQRDDGRLYHYASLVQTETLGWGSERIYYPQRQLAIAGHAAIVQELQAVLMKLDAMGRRPG